MRIAQIAPCWIPVPPPGYGGIELVVAHLADGLVESGHDVTLFASGGSQTKAKLVTYWDEPPGTVRLVTHPLDELPHVLNAYEHAAEFDVIHDHTFPLGPSIGAQLSAPPPVVHTLHGPPSDPGMQRILEFIDPKVGFVAISNYQRSAAPGLNYAGTVYNGIPVERYTFKEKKEDYLLFLGRMSPQKGAHLAVETARRLGRRLVMATKMAEPGEEEYFEAEVKPLLTGDVEILGEVAFDEKVALYADAACTLMPIQWPEPFGLVMTESMACGTPVVAMRNGSVPEIVDHGINGFVADDLDSFVGYVAEVGSIEPETCRRSVEERFSTEAMVSGYEAVYESLTASRESGLQPLRETNSSTEASGRHRNLNGA